MSEEKNNQTNTEEVKEASHTASQDASEEKSAPEAREVTPQKKEGVGASRGGGRAERRPRRPRRSPRRGRQERVKPEFEQKVITIRRVTRVVAGGRRFSFSVALVAGDRKGRVGVGLGKSPDTASAIEKAVRDAKKNMITVALDKNNSIPHEVQAKFASTEVIIRPSPGKGLVAGSSVRTVLDLAGVTDVSSKILSRSKNRFNNARAAIKALNELAKTKK